MPTTYPESTSSTTLRGERESTPPTEQTWVVPLASIVVDREIEEAAADAVRSGWWSMGPRVAELESEFASFCGAKHAFAVANGTAALHLALVGVGCGLGGEVVVPSLNFVAAANTIGHAGANAVFCDIGGPDDLNVDPASLEAAITPRTRAMIVMHYGGHPCRMDAVLDVAARHGLAVVEDAAHAPGATWHGRKCGTIGDVGCFSFFSNKNLPVGEGGMVVTDDDAVAERIRLLRSHGMTTLTWDRHRGHASTYDVVAQGFNYRLDEIRAAIGLVQLRRLERHNDDRARIVERYRAALDGVNGLTMPFAEEREGIVPAHHLAVVVLPPSRPRDEFRAALAKRGIQTSVHYPPIHHFSAYWQGERTQLPKTDEVAARLVTLPLYAHMTDGDVHAVVAAALEST